MAQAIRLSEAGGPEVLRLEQVTVPDPGPGEIRITQRYAGLNYIDTYQRSGLYPLQFPTGLGLEGVGTVTACGPGVADLKSGDRVAYAGGPLGAYASERVMPADAVVAVPDGIDDKAAAGMMLQGLTVQYLLRSTYRVSPGETVLFHAAAGGVGLIACQWARHLGIRLIGTAGSDEKCALAKAHGAAECINYNTQDWVARLRELTDGQGVPVVYDSVGQSTWDGSLDCLRPRGLMVSFGNASGPVPPVNLGILAQKGSLYVTRPTLFSYIATRKELRAAAAELFEVVGNGAVTIAVNHTYPLADAAQAHRDLEARKTTGSVVFSL